MTVGLLSKTISLQVIDFSRDIEVSSYGVRLTGTKEASPAHVAEAEEGLIALPVAVAVITETEE